MAILGVASQLISGTLDLTMPDLTRYWFVQNQDAAPMTIHFPAGSGATTIIINPGQSAGYAGDWMDIISFPYIGPITLTGASSAPFGSGCFTVRSYWPLLSTPWPQ